MQLCDGRGGLLHARITGCFRKQVTVEALLPPIQVRGDLLSTVQAGQNDAAATECGHWNSGER